MDGTIFPGCGDHTPNGNEIKLSASVSDVYQDYVSYCEAKINKLNQIHEDYCSPCLRIIEDDDSAKKGNTPDDSSSSGDDEDEVDDDNIVVNNNEIESSVNNKKIIAAAMNPEKNTTRKRNKKGIVSFSKFVNIWRSIFPTVACRPYVDIPGKCFTCYEIDRQRRSTSNSVVQKLLAEAHILHRGGMFMLERLE